MREEGGELRREGGREGGRQKGGEWLSIPTTVYTKITSPMVPISELSKRAPKAVLCTYVVSIRGALLRAMASGVCNPKFVQQKRQTNAAFSLGSRARGRWRMSPSTTGLLCKKWWSPPNVPRQIQSRENLLYVIQRFTHRPIRLCDLNYQALNTNSLPYYLLA